MKPTLLLKSGFSLVEVALALGVAGFCLSAIVGLMPVGMKSNQCSIEQTAAASIARAVTADLRATAKEVLSQSPGFHFTLPDNNSSGAMAPLIVFLDENGNLAPGNPDSAVIKSGTHASKYRVSVGFISPGAGQRTALMARILVTWPAFADQTPSGWPSNYSGFYETFVSMVRN